MTRALYRRYRPIRLEDVVGQEQVTKPLMNSLSSGKISHAYLFIGPRGCGKTSVARIFAHEVNGFKYELEDDYVDIVEIDGASNRGIDNIRELREKAAIAPTAGKYKIYIIDEVHMLTKEAFNALLKTLEEPPEHVIFIMATTDAHKVPVTITSRAQTYTFKLSDDKTMLGHLRKIADKENIKIADDALKIIVKRGGGSFRDSLSLLDQISTLTTEEITKDLVISAMGLPEDDKIAALLDFYIHSDMPHIKDALQDLLSSGIKAETIAEEMIGMIVENPRAELIDLLAKLPDVKAPFAEAKLLVALCENFNKIAQASLAPATTTTTVATTMVAVTKSDTTAASVAASGRISSTDFNWTNFVETVRGLNDAISSQLKSVDYAVNGDTLDIYPLKRIAKTILARDNNKKILVMASGGLKVVVHDMEDNPNLGKDELISKMSAIMGGEVQNDGGGNPF